MAYKLNKEEDMSNDSKHVTITSRGLSYSGTIDDAKDLAIELREMASNSGDDLSKLLGDFIFEIELRYQNFYELHPDNWDKVEE
jgi:hypothetical protein